MPIKGLTDRESVVPRFTRLGKIKKGEIVNGQPVDLDYFRFVGEGARANEIEAAFREAYGSEPREISVYLPYKTVDENWQTWMEEWGKSGLIHRCDGEYMVQWLREDKTYETDYDQRQRKPCPYESGQKQRTKSNPGCTQVGRLSVIVPELLQAGFIGYVTVELHSINDLHNLTASLLDAEAKSGATLNPNGLQGIEFKLCRQIEEIGVRYQNKRGDIIKTRGQKWMVRIDPAQQWVLHQLETSRQMALGHSIKRPALTVVEAKIVDIADNGEPNLMPTDAADSPFADREQTEAADDAESPTPGQTEIAQDHEDREPNSSGDTKDIISEAHALGVNLRTQAGWEVGRDGWVRRGGDVVGTAKVGQQVAAIMTAALEGVEGLDAEKPHHVVLNYLFKVPGGSTKALTVAEATTLVNRWGNGTEWEPVNGAAEEIRLLARAALLEAGQQTMEL
jgi:hypothetical protein